MKLEVHVDEFLGRRGGKRKKQGLGKDAALGNYLKAFPNKGVLIFHTKYSNSVYSPLLTFKTLSHFLGGHPISRGVSKVILLEKQAAIQVFGYGCGMMCSRAGYFLSYTAYAKALGIDDPKDLTPYGKHHMLRHREKEQKVKMKAIETEEEASCSIKYVDMPKDN